MRSFSSFEIGEGSAFQPLLQPDFFLRPLDVHVLAADPAAIGFAQQIDHLAQRRLAAAAEGVAKRIRVKMPVEIPDRQPVRQRIELGVVGRLGAQRIEIGHQMPAHTEGVDQPGDRRALDDIDRGFRPTGAAAGALSAAHFTRA